MGSEKVSIEHLTALTIQACAYMRTLLHHEAKDLATVLPQADPLGESLTVEGNTCTQKLIYTPSARSPQAATRILTLFPY
jgi:hypothetical protein